MSETAEPSDNKNRLTNNRSNKMHLKDPFLTEYRKHGTIGLACEKVGLERRTIQRWRHEDKEFAEKFIACDLGITEVLERSALARALDRNSRDSATLTIFLLKARNPEKYKERYQQDLDPKVVETMVSQFLNAVKKHAPDFCPHCKNHLGLPEKISKELETLSNSLSNS
jgi:hypothetical protein